MGPEALAAHVAAEHGLGLPDLVGRSRRRDVVDARAAAMVALRRYHQMSYPAIGRVLDRDHTTVLETIARHAPELTGNLDPPSGPKTCVVEGCGRPVKTRGWCEAHYERWRRHGDPLAAGPVRVPDRVWTACESCGGRPLGGSRWCGPGRCAQDRGRWTWSAA